MTEPPKFKILYQRVLGLGDYSTLRIGFEQEYYVGEKNPQEAFLEAGRLVNEVIMRRLGEENQTQVTVETRQIEKPQPQNSSLQWRSTRSGEEVLDIAGAQSDPHLREVITAARAHTTHRTTDDVFQYRLWRGADRELIFREPKARRR